MERSQHVATTEQTSKPVPVDLKAAGVDGWLYVLRQVAEQREQLDEVEEKAQAAIKEALGDNAEGAIDGEPVVRWTHTAAPRRFNRKQFAKDHPDLERQYIEVGEPGRRFELVKPKGASGK
jgi:hypothetical protein